MEKPILEKSKNIFGKIVESNDGTYYYKLILYGCNGATKTIINFFDIRHYAALTSQSEQNNNVLSQDLDKRTENIVSNSTLFTNNIENLDNQIKINPNPANDFVQINGIDKNKDIFIQIYDEKGIIVKNLFKLDNQDLNISFLKTGIYFFNIYVDGKLTSKKIAKL